MRGRANATAEARLALGLGAAILLMALGGGLRLWLMERTFPVRLLGDEVYYTVVAAHLASGRGHLYGPDALALRPPAQPWVLSHAIGPDALQAGPGKLGVRLDRLRPAFRVEVALGTLLVLATAVLGAALFDARTGSVAGLLAALDPTLVAYSHFLWSETLCALLITLALAAAVTAAARQRTGFAALAGALFGAAAMTREIALPAAVACALWCLCVAPNGARRRAAASAALLLAVCALVVLPWSLRNRSALGRLVPVATGGWIATGEGNVMEGWHWLGPHAPGRDAFRARVHAVEGELARSDRARELTLELIRAQQPGWLFAKLARNVPLLLSPDSYPLYKLRQGSYGEVSPATRRAVLLAVTLAWAGIFCAAVLGIAAARGPGQRLLPALVLGSVVAVHVVANANSRFRVPWLPLLMAYAAHALRGGRASWRALSRRERVGASAALALFAALFVSYFFVNEAVLD